MCFRRFFLGISLVYFFLLAPLWAAAQPVHVVIVGVRGKGAGAPVIQGLQVALEKLKNISFESTRNFLAEAGQRGLGDTVETDPKAMSTVARALEIDSVVRGELTSSARTKDKVLTLSVFNGGDGKLLGEEVVTLPAGKLSAKVYSQAARAIEPYLRLGDHRHITPGPLAASEPKLSGAEEGQTEAVVEPDDEGEALDPAVRLRAGLATMKRSFDYKARLGSPLFFEKGITYESSLSPGFAVQAEVFPLAFSKHGPLARIGVALDFAKTFLSTVQTISETAMGEIPATTSTRKLETSHSALRAGLMYRHPFWQGEKAPEIMGGLGYGRLSFKLEDNPEYRGTELSYFDVALGFVMPLGTPLAVADVTFRLMPSVDHGTSVQELSKTADTLGYAVAAGLGSRFDGGFGVRLGLDYSVFSSQLAGAGRGGRLGKSAEDSYLGLQLQAAYTY
ncbi:MAG: hypothetical protein EXR76_17940 [Myxococcales bacterium]|nr:hypothetical protein [Myxococcales bacterium]